MQLLICNLTLSDFILNIFYKIRYYIINHFYISELNYRSESIKQNYTLVFEDDFEKIDCSYDGEKTKWIVGEGWGLFHPDYLKSYFIPIKKLYNNTCAVFEVKYSPKEFDNPKTHKKILIPFATTKISTNKSFKQQYGRFECRCTLPEEKGVWPAFWLWGETWPPEIDVFEVYGRKKGKSNNVQEINLHYGFTDNNTKSQMSPWKIKIDDKELINTIFHEYAVEWTSTKIEIFIDGIKVFRYSNKNILDKYFNTDNANMHIVMNHGIEEEYFIENNKDFRSEFLVDYIRAYEIIK